MERALKNSDVNRVPTQPDEILKSLIIVVNKIPTRETLCKQPIPIETSYLSLHKAYKLNIPMKPITALCFRDSFRSLMFQTA